MGLFMVVIVQGVLNVHNKVSVWQVLSCQDVENRFTGLSSVEILSECGATV